MVFFRYRKTSSNARTVRPWYIGTQCLDNFHSSKKQKNCRFYDNERYVIGKYAAIHGQISAVKKFNKSNPHLEFGESTARSLRNKYTEKHKLSEHSIVIATKQVGHPRMLGAIDEKVRHFLMIIRRKGGVVNTVVANATVRVLLGRSHEEHLKCIDHEHSSWAKRLFRRMGLVKRTCTTWKPELPEKVKNEAKLILQHQIVNFF